MKNKWKKVICGSLAMIMILSTFAMTMVGCGKKEEEQIVYELTPLTEENLEAGKYYVKSGDVFYEMPSSVGRASFDEKSLIAKEAASERTLMFGKDDVFIPTMYKDDQLIYVTKEAIPTSFTWERYEDNGYTIGIMGLTQNEAGRYAVEKSSSTIKSDSTFGQYFTDVADKETVIVDKVNNSSVSNATVSNGGSVTGLTYETEYKVDAYIGSEYIEATATADTHAFTSFEVYETTTYNFAQANYIILTVPEYFRSGYYLVNGIGFVKYANVLREEGIAGINFNAPYYLGFDENGNVITADNQDENSESTETTIEHNVYRTSCAIDCTNESMRIELNYSDVLDKVNGVELNLPNAVKESLNSTELKAILISPDGTEYTFVPSYEVQNQMICMIDMPLSGEWEVELTGFDLRTFDLVYKFTSGHSDTLIHSGSGKAQMTYYLNNSLDNAVFNISWENKDRAADIIIQKSDGTKYSKAENEACILEEGYGFTKVLVDNATYGNYGITISGDDLGRVRVTVDGLSTEAAAEAPVDNSVQETVIE